MKTLSLDPAYTDFRALTRLKSAARNNSPKALEETAKQFEAIFIGKMLKSMRGASIAGGDGLLDNDQVRFYRDMFDQQLALTLANRGGLGLARMIERQLSEGPTQFLSQPQQKADLVASDRQGPALLNSSTKGSSGPENHMSAPLSSSPEQFVEQLWPHAYEAAQALGVTPRILIAQAALETGWGQKLPRFADGHSSHNLFGIKADRGWPGNTIVNTTLEFVGDVPVRRRDGFRAYSSYAESFEDYVAFVKTNPRYQDALQQTDDKAYIRALHRAGYATDPQYANKVERILTGSTLSRAIESLKSLAHGPIVNLRG